MDEDQRHFWVVRASPGGIEVPILCEQDAETFRRVGWEVTRLPLAALEDEDLRSLRYTSIRERR